MNIISQFSSKTYLINKSVTLGTQILKGLRTRPRTLGTGEPPAFAHGAAALVSLVEASDVVGANAEAVVQVARLASLVDASGARGIQG